MAFNRKRIRLTLKLNGKDEVFTSDNQNKLSAVGLRISADVTFGYPKGAILQSDDEKKEYQSLIDNNKVNFNTESNISASWELVGAKYAIKNEVDLALLKKFDKENVSGALGNDNNKVPSLNLFTTETEKLATKAELTSGLAGKQPAGDYVTNTALNNGLNQKLNTSSVVQSTGSSTTQVMSQDAATKAFLKSGDFGIGTQVSFEDMTINAEDNPFGLTGGAKMTSPPNDPVYQASLFWTKGGIFRLAGRTSDQNGALNDVIEFYSTGNSFVDRNGNLAVTGYNELSDYPVGAPIPWPQSTAPTGFLTCNGQSFDKTTYPLLAKAYPSGVLPDLRGEFIRGLDAGRDIDSNRSVLSSQSDALQRITGSFGNFKALPSSFISEGAFQVTGTTGGSDDDAPEGPSSFDFDSARVTRSADETRPRNIAFLYIVRAA